LIDSGFAYAGDHVGRFNGQLSLQILGVACSTNDKVLTKNGISIVDNNGDKNRIYRGSYITEDQNPISFMTIPGRSGFRQGKPDMR